MKILVKAPLGAYSGWGQDGIGLVSALLRQGHEVLVQPVEVVPPLPKCVARRLEAPLVPPFDLTIAHVSADKCALSGAERDASRLRVLWSMWEWTTFANHPRRGDIAAGLASYDVVAAYDPVSASAFGDLTGTTVPVVQVQGGFDADAWTPVEREWRPPVRYLVAGHITDRKDPYVALQAFGELLDEHGEAGFDAELHVKFVDRAEPFISPPSPRVDLDRLPAPSRAFATDAASRRRLFLHSGTWPRELLRALYGQMHCLVAPSRGEGKNLVALEFLATGGPVIATRVGGHAVWLDKRYAYPLEARTQPASWPTATTEALEAAASVADLKALMWRVYMDLDEAAAKGAAGAAEIPSRCSWDSAVAKLSTALDAFGVHGLASPA